jgi:hypothetical protein
MADPYRPFEVTEPITGLTWIARNRGQYLLAWWPAALVLIAFGLGWACCWMLLKSGVIG